MKWCARAICLWAAIATCSAQQSFTGFWSGIVTIQQRVAKIALEIFPKNSGGTLYVDGVPRARMQQIRVVKDRAYFRVGHTDVLCEARFQKTESLTGNCQDRGAAPAPILMMRVSKLPEWVNKPAGRTF
jgi:hypothetical protein